MNKTVLITGSSSGFGRLAVKRFQQQGWNVVASMRAPERETELGLLERVLVTRLDVTDPASIKASVAAAEDLFGRIDVLVNNAGYGAVGYLEEASAAEIERQMDTNFTGSVRCIQAVLPLMRRQRSGVIINVTSIGGLLGVPMFSLYSASKFALEGLSQSLNYELSAFGIEVHTVAPGAFKTDFGTATRFFRGAANGELADYRDAFERHYQNMMANLPKPFSYGDPEQVVAQMLRCAEGAAPRTHVIGRDARMMLWLRRLLPRKRFFQMCKATMLPFYS